MLTKKLFFACWISLLSLCALAQQNSGVQQKHFATTRLRAVNVASIQNDWKVGLQNFDNPFEGNRAYAEQMRKLKLEAGMRFPKKHYAAADNIKAMKASADTCVVLDGFEGNFFSNNLPNDNTLAVSNNGMLVSDINSTIFMFDTQNDTLLKAVSLSAFSDTLQLYPDQYDPKVLYDPSADKFVMVYLAGFQDSTSNIILAFSETNDPLGWWNLYALPGNPLSDTSWSDFPAIALTNNELFLTVNLLSDTGEWQTAFKQSIIWQIDKNKGYNGDTLKSKLWSDISPAGNKIRNLHPIQGGSALTGPDMYFLSSRNFALQSDSIFLLHIPNVLSDTNAVLGISTLISDRTYGMPPNADQPLNQTLATNDARVLGGFIENDMIQFVGNTIDTASGYAAFYHGIISNVSTTPSVHLNIISDTVEMGYPNISYTGAGSTDASAIISVNYTGKFTFPGFCAFNYNGSTGTYSSRGILKAGNTHVNFFSGTAAERWGDYSGSQRVYNEPGKVWVSGNFGKKINAFKRVNATWISQLQKAAPNAGLEDYETEADRPGINLYPNPVEDIMTIDLAMPYDAVIDVSLYDVTGRPVRLLLHGRARKGQNILSFSTNPLSPGTYILSVRDAGNIFLTKKIIKE